MTNYEIIVLVLLGLIGFWLFSIACMFAKLTKHTEEQSTAVILLIGAMLNKIQEEEGENNNDTTGEENP